VAKVEVESSRKQRLKAAYHMSGSNVETKRGRPRVNLGSTWGQPGVNLHHPTDALDAGVEDDDDDDADDGDDASV